MIAPDRYDGAAYAPPGASDVEPVRHSLTEATRLPERLSLDGLIRNSGMPRDPTSNAPRRQRPDARAGPAAGRAPQGLDGRGC